jgi:hypothetical protein
LTLVLLWVSDDYENTQSLQISPKLLQLYSQSGIAKLGMIEEFITDLIESCPKFLVFAHHKVRSYDVCLIYSIFG